METSHHLLVVLFVAVSLGLLNQCPESFLRSTNLLLFNPEYYHGENVQSNFFEGWYYKMVPPKSSSSKSVAIVPGIFFGNSTNSSETHAFIFVNDGGDLQHYYRFPISDFSFSKPSDGAFSVSIGNNHFTSHSISVNLSPKENDDATLTIAGELTFTNLSPWPVTTFGLGAMGFVGWMPFLECTHGVLSFDHEIQGQLVMDGVEMEYHGGRGYIEKDHGSKFPSLWIWIQTNSFAKHPGTSLFFSVARIPTLGTEFPGFTAAVWHDNILVPFASYTGASFEILDVNEKEIHLRIRGSGHSLDVTADRQVPHALLYGPVDGNRMFPSVREALSSTVRMVFTRESDGVVLVDDIGSDAGLEVHRDVEWLRRNMCGEESAGWLICL